MAGGFCATGDEKCITLFPRYGAGRGAIACSIYNADFALAGVGPRSMKTAPQLPANVAARRENPCSPGVAT